MSQPSPDATGLICVVVPHGGPAWRRTVELRLEVLRRPLGLSFDAGDLEAEVHDLHLAAFQGDELVGCLVLSPIDRQPPSFATVRMRQVAVRPDLQRAGIGARLVRESEDQARRLGHRVMLLHARETAVPFYLRLDYQQVGQPYVEVGLPHRTMEKSLR